MRHTHCVTENGNVGHVLIVEPVEETVQYVVLGSTPGRKTVREYVVYELILNETVAWQMLDAVIDMLVTAYLLERLKIAYIATCGVAVEHIFKYFYCRVLFLLVISSLFLLFLTHVMNCGVPARVIIIAWIASSTASSSSGERPMLFFISLFLQTRIVLFDCLYLSACLALTCDVRQSVFYSFFYFFGYHQDTVI